MMSNLPEKRNIGDWVVAIQAPEVVQDAPVVVLLHGWTGDENSMWVFTSQIPKHALIIAPRGLFLSKHAEFSGFSWVEDQSEKWAEIGEFSQSVEGLHDLIAHLRREYPADFTRMNLAGFSQGAALAAAYLLAYPQQVARLAMLSGFLPVGAASENRELANTDIFIGHGSLDEIVPEAKAVEAYRFFQNTGAKVNYCVTEVGHKLGSDCFKGFNQFMANI